MMFAFFCLAAAYGASRVFKYAKSNPSQTFQAASMLKGLFTK